MAVPISCSVGSSSDMGDRLLGGYLHVVSASRSAVSVVFRLGALILGRYRR
jgi:hypothetical protein